MPGVRLSGAQLRAVAHSRGHLRIIACPGSGKTETVSRRVASLVKNGADPSGIVAFTFAEKAAGELKLRIRGLLEAECPGRADLGGIHVGTIDSYCLEAIKRLAPRYRQFEVLDSARRAAFMDRWYLQMGIGRLDRGAGKWRTIAKFCRSADLVLQERLDERSLSDRDFTGCLGAYREKLRDERFFDFVSIVHSLLELVRGDAEARGRLRGEVRHVVLDEYQDVNALQEDLLEELSEGAESVCVVGDDDQNIFQWRGSNVAHIIEFPAKYERRGVSTERLEVNYRATDALVETASRFISRNERRVKKRMRAHGGQPNSFERGDIVCHHFDDDGQEFGFIEGAMRALAGTRFADRRGGGRPLSYRDMAVLVRTNEDAARATQFFEGRGIPCVADSGTSVFDRRVVRLALDCLLWAFGHPGYGSDAVPDPGDLAARYAEAVPRGDAGRFRGDLGRAGRRADEIAGRGAGWLPNLGLQEFYHRILSAMGAEREGELTEEDMYNLAVLSRAISDYEYVYRSIRAAQVAGLKWFISQFAESNYADPAHSEPGLDAVRVLTIWKAKGLEFPAVFVPAFEKPWKRQRQAPVFVDAGLYDKARYDGDDEDDRRAYYTAITRSQKYLFLTGSRRRGINVTRTPRKSPREPHPFADEVRNGRFSGPDVPSRPRAGGPAPGAPPGSVPASYSALSIYGRCPHDYRLRHVMGFSAGVPAAFGYGTNVHNILNRIHADYTRKGRVPGDSEIDGMLDEMFHMRFAPGPVSDNMRKAAARVAKNYVAAYGGDFGRILDAERPFEFTLGEALVSGRIDLIKSVDEDGAATRIEIIDFKTDARGGEGRYELDHAEQARFYAYAARSSLGYVPEKAVIHHLDTQEAEPVDLGGAALDATRDGIIEKIGMISSRRFDPAPAKARCEGCDFRALCPHKGFEVGVDFGPVKAERRDNGTVRTEGEEDVAPGPPVVSDSMRKRAEALAACGLARGEDGAYRIPSSSGGGSYAVTASRCECRGFRTSRGRHPGAAPTCYHVEAVKIAEGGAGARP